MNFTAESSPFRGLQSTNDLQEYETSTKIAQIFSGLFFTGVVAYLVFSNSTKLAIIQQASQEKRLSVCCSLTTMVAAISGFLNFFQITEVDNHFLPKQNQYSVDLCRPVEWILTCPILQLTLVLMGGPRIPDYRRILMPGFAATIMTFGILSLFLDEPETFFCYGAGVLFFIGMAYFNRLQILEFSDGEEGLLQGYSEFRKATIILLLTWAPFPLWYMLSPEGVGVIDNILIIQMGWMLTNIISKGAFILYIQKAKENYLARVKVTKVMKGFAEDGQHAHEDGDEGDGALDAAQLRPCVTETMNYLGMADKAERFLKLLTDAKITNLQQLEDLSAKDCEDKRLPHNLIVALQQRHRLYKFEVNDDIEEGILQGERHYAPEKKTNQADSPREPSQSGREAQTPPSIMIPQTPAPGMHTPAMGMEPVSVGPPGFPFDGMATPKTDRPVGFQFDSIMNDQLASPSFGYNQNSQQMMQNNQQMTPSGQMMAPSGQMMTPTSLQMPQMGRMQQAYFQQGESSMRSLPEEQMAPQSQQELIQKVTEIGEHLKALSRLEEKLETGRFSKSGEQQDGTLSNQAQLETQSMLRDVEKNTGACKGAVEYGLQSMNRSYEKFDRFEALLLEKFEFVQTSSEKRQQRMQEDIQDLTQLVRKFANQVAEVNQNHQSTLASVGHTLEEAVVKNRATVEEVIAKHQSTLTTVGEALDESLLKNQVSIDSLLASVSDKVEDVVNKNQVTLHTMEDVVASVVNKNQATLNTMEDVVARNEASWSTLSRSVEEAWHKNQATLTTLCHAVEEAWNRNQASITSLNHSVEEVGVKTQSGLTSVSQSVDKNQATLATMTNSIEEFWSKNERTLATLSHSMEEGWAKNQALSRTVEEGCAKNQATLSTLSRSVEEEWAKNHAALSTVSRSVEEGWAKNQGTFSTLSRFMDTTQTTLSTFSRSLDESWAKHQALVTTLSASVDESLAKNQASFKSLTHAVEEAISKVRMSPPQVVQQDMSPTHSALSRDQIQLDKFLSSWAEQIMAEARSNTCTLQSKIATMEEAHVKTRFELESQLSNKIDEASRASRDACISKITGDFTQELRRSEELQAQSLRRVTTDVSASVEKHVSIGTGIINQALKSWCESLQDGQVKVETKIVSQFETHASKMFHQKEELLQSYSTTMKAEIRDHKQLTNSTLEQASAAKERCKECCDLIANVSDRLFSTGGMESSSPVILQRRPSSAVNRSRRNMIMLT